MGSLILKKGPDLHRIFHFVTFVTFCIFPDVKGLRKHYPDAFLLLADEKAFDVPLLLGTNSEIVNMCLGMQDAFYPTQLKKLMNATILLGFFKNLISKPFF